MVTAQGPSADLPNKFNRYAAGSSSSRGARIRPISVAVVLTAAMCGTVALSGTARASQGGPPCSQHALTAGLRRGANPFLQGRLVRPWGCAGRFAYAAVIVSGNELTILFRAHRAHWETASRSRYCPSGGVPSRIWQNACNTN
jgi:hypothetical protein